MTGGLVSADIGDEDSMGYPVSIQSQEEEDKPVDKEVEAETKPKKFGVTAKKMGLEKKNWDPYDKNTRLRLDGFMKRSKHMDEKEMLNKWLEFVEHDLNMGFINNAVVRGVILAPVTFIVNQVSRLKKQMNVKTKYDDGNIYLYKGRNF